MSVLLAYKLVWAQIHFFERAQGAPSSENWPCSAKLITHDAAQNIFSSRVMQNPSVQFCAEFLPHGARQWLVHKQHWHVWLILMFLLGQLPSSFVVEQPCYLKNRIMFEMAY